MSTPQIPANAPCPLPGLNVADVDLILTALGGSTLPYVHVAALAHRIQAMAQQALLRGPVDPVPAVEEYSVPTSEDRIIKARAQLETATTEYRRTGEGTLNVPLLEDPYEDYAPPCSLVSEAIRQLDEALPNRQAQRALAAYAALCAGTELVGAYLRRRVTP